MSRLCAHVDERILFIMSNAPARYRTLQEFEAILGKLEVSREELVRGIKDTCWFETNNWWDCPEVASHVAGTQDLTVQVRNKDGSVSYKRLGHATAAPRPSCALPQS